MVGKIYSVVSPVTLENVDGSASRISKTFAAQAVRTGLASTVGND
jgi:hypothetical protein